MQKKLIFFIFFSYNLPAGTLSSVLKIELFAKIFFLHALFQSAQHLSERREGSGSGSVCPNEGFFTEEFIKSLPVSIFGP
jgi:hypothetical protein